MPKVSNAPTDALETQMGIQAGNVEILAAVCKVHQYPENKKTHNQSAPFTCGALQLQKLDDDMDPLEDSEPEWAYYALGKDSLEKYHPGNIDSRDDNDPTDEGDDVDTEGNTINSVNGDQLNKKCKWMALMASMEKCGMKPEILKGGYMPDFVGIKGHVYTIKMDKIEDSKEPPTVLVFDKITVFPGKSKGKEKEKVKPADKKTDKKTEKGAEKKEKADAGGDEETSDKGKEILVALAGKFSGTSCPVKKLKTLAHTEMIKDKTPGTMAKAVLALFDTDWLSATGKDELELIEEIDDGVVTFV